MHVQISIVATLVSISKQLQRSYFSSLLIADRELEMVSVQLRNEQEKCKAAEFVFLRLRSEFCRVKQNGAYRQIMTSRRIKRNYTSYVILIQLRCTPSI